QHRAVNAAVGRGLHAAGARGLARPQRGVEPHVAALHELTGDVDVVVLDEYQAAAELRIAGLNQDVLDELLAALVARMGLSGEDDLDWPIAVVEQANQTRDVAKEQCRSLVGREAAREADRQRLGVENL